MFYMAEGQMVDKKDPVASFVINLFGQSQNQDIYNNEYLSVFIGYTYSMAISLVVVMSFAYDAVLKYLFVINTG